MKPFIFTLSPGEDQKKIHHRIEAVSAFDLAVTDGDRVDGFILDNFENEIRRSGQLLMQIEESLLLIDISSGQNF